MVTPRGVLSARTTAAVVLATAGAYFLLGAAWATREGWEFAGPTRPLLGGVFVAAAVALLVLDARTRGSADPSADGARGGQLTSQLKPRTVVLYTREMCSLCEEAAAVLRKIAAEEGVEVWEEDVDRSPDLAARYGDRVPVAVMGGRELFEFKVDVAKLRESLRAS